MNQSDFFLKAQTWQQQKLPFVIYRKPAKEKSKSFRVKGCFQTDDKLHIATDFTSSGFVIAPFDFQKDSIIIPYEKAEQEEVQVDFHPEKENQPPVPEENKAAKKHHLNLVSKGIEAIENKVFQKVVLSRKLELPTTKEPIDIFKSLLHTYPTAFVYCWYHPQVGLWLGATPETLVKISDKTLKTMALAGTKSVLEADTPQWTDKERAEQQLVTDFIKEQIAPQVSHLSIEKVESIRAGKLWHLKCDIKARLKQTGDLKQLLSGLHPTPAVCGLPKEITQKFIIDHENYDRAFYTGFIGELNRMEKPIRKANRRNIENQAYTRPQKHTHLFVNLRCLQHKAGKCQLYVGGGIVSGSEPESEWQETVNKSHTMLDVL